jgi:hypothetical protein
MSNERILVADLGHKWLQDAEFKAEYDALSDEFALVTATGCEPEHHSETWRQEIELPRNPGKTPQIR